MTLKRSVVFCLVLIGGLSLMGMLPDSYGLKNSAVVPSFPLPKFSEWTGTAQETPQLVIDTLADDTTHLSVIYSREAPESGISPKYDQISAFMVLSGADMNASIHRPERCFRSQGLTINNRTQKTLKFDGGELPVTILDAERTLIQGAFKGQVLRQKAYYWFVGHDKITNSHYDRALTDVKDRILRGYNQRWAYIMITMNYGLDIPELMERDPEGVAKTVEGAIAKLYPYLHKSDQLAD